MKIWVLVEKIGPPPGHKKKSPCTFDRVFSCLTAEEEGDKVGNNIVCSFLAPGKIIIKEGQEKTCQNRWFKISPEENLQTNLPLNSDLSKTKFVQIKPEILSKWITQSGVLRAVKKVQCTAHKTRYLKLSKILQIKLSLLFHYPSLLDGLFPGDSFRHRS